MAQLPTRLGPCEVMRQNPWNACVALGHAKGVVTMWAPNTGTPLVRMLCHQVRNESQHPCLSHGISGQADRFFQPQYKSSQTACLQRVSSCVISMLPFSLH